MGDVHNHHYRYYRQAGALYHRGRQAGIHHLAPYEDRFLHEFGLSVFYQSLFNEDACV
jgi:hypothetical protein